MDFWAWLESASEDDKRLASDWVYHYPTEVTVWDLGDDGPGETLVVCGCNPAFQYTYGTGKHGATN